MITRLRIVGFKSHADTTLELGRLTCLVGPNGSGKSAVLEALLSLHNSGDGLGKCLKRGATKVVLEVGVKTADGRVFDLSTSNRIDANELESLGIARLYLDPQRIAEPSYSQTLPPTMQADGYGLASVLSHWILGAQPAKAQLVDLVSKIVPAVKDIRARLAAVTVEKKELTGQELLFDFRGALGIPARQVSTGTLLATALIASLIQMQDVEMLLLDDIESGLHPRAQRELVRILAKSVEERPNLQVVFTTHSPYVVDELAPDQVVVLALDATGSTLARKLSDHPDAAKALEVLTTGEFLAAEGEDWLVETLAPAEGDDG